MILSLADHEKLEKSTQMFDFWKYIQYIKTLGFVTTAVSSN